VNSEEMTAEKFVDVPLDGQTKRLYKTGDICRWLADGNIEFLGRKDEQVKIRGLRIELGEIESALSMHPSVSAAAVCVVGDGADKRLAAYTVQRTALHPRLLRDYLRQQLPDYMVPAHYVSIDQLPLTASGKVDRSVLPPVHHSAEADGPGAPVDPELRRKVAEIWRAVLGVNSAREDQDFFDLGGHSLLATKMVARVERDLGVSLPVTSCFEHSTLGELADLVAASVRPGALRCSNHFVKRLLWMGGGTFVRHIKQVLQPEAEFVPVGLDLAQWASFAAPYHLDVIARAYAETIISRYSEGPYMLGGHCYEGVLAFEMAQQLRALGSQVDLVVVVDADTPLSRFGVSSGQRVTARLQKELFHVSSLARTSVTEWVPYLYGRLETLMADRRRRSWEIEESNSQGIDGESEIQRILHLAMIKYKPAPYGGRFVFFQAQDRPRGWYWDLTMEWRPLVGEHGEFHEIPGNHTSILMTPNVTVFAERLKRAVMQPSPSAVT
jgi:thioesterase domain-containing protein/acyl carrier protein